MKLTLSDFWIIDYKGRSFSIFKRKNSSPLPQYAIYEGDDFLADCFTFKGVQDWIKDNA